MRKTSIFSLSTIIRAFSHFILRISGLTKIARKWIESLYGFYTEQLEKVKDEDKKSDIQKYLVSMATQAKGALDKLSAYRERLDAIYTNLQRTTRVSATHSRRMERLAQLAEVPAKISTRFDEVKRKFEEFEETSEIFRKNISEWAEKERFGKNWKQAEYVLKLFSPEILGAYKKAYFDTVIEDLDKIREGFEDFKEYLRSGKVPIKEEDWAKFLEDKWGEYKERLGMEKVEDIDEVWGEFLNEPSVAPYRSTFQEHEEEAKKILHNIEYKVKEKKPEREMYSEDSNVLQRRDTVKNIESIVNDLAESLSGKKFAVKELAKVFGTVADEKRNDMVINLVNKVIQQRATEKPESTMNPSEIYELYDQFVSMNPETEFTEIFEPYLPEKEGKPDSLDEVNRMRHTYYEDAPRDLSEVSSARTTEVIEGDEIEKKEVPAEFKPLVEDVEDKLARDTSGFSKELINRAHELIVGELNSLGVKGQVRFSRRKGSSMVFATSLDTEKGTIQVDIPIEVADEKILYPVTFVYKDAVHALTEEGLERFIRKFGAEAEPVKYPGEMLDMTFNQLRKEIHKAVFERNYARATECLNVVSDKFGEDIHKNAIQDYQNWLKEASQDYSTRCGKCGYYLSKTAVATTHTQDWCGLLDEPCFKIIQKSGICVRSSILWDELRDDSYKGTISTSKIALT